MAGIRSRIAQLASNAYEAPSIQMADYSIEQMAKILADRVLRDSWDVACELLPAACYTTVVVTGSILVREPLHVRPICQIIDLHLPRARVSRVVREAFMPRSGGPMSRFIVDERTDRPKAEADGLRQAPPALDANVVIDEVSPDREP